MNMSPRARIMLSPVVGCRITSFLSRSIPEGGAGGCHRFGAFPGIFPEWALQTAYIIQRRCWSSRFRSWTVYAVTRLSPLLSSKKQEESFQMVHRRSPARAQRFGLFSRERIHLVVRFAPSIIRI
jgi:hypothetical protein